MGEHPSTLGKYQVAEYLGRGSFGDVYRVHDESGDEYALKWLQAGVGYQGTARFKNEVWALSNLDHPVIPQILDQGEWEGRPWYVMTLARGTPLRDVYKKQVEERGTSSEFRVLTIAVNVLDALAHMHDRAIFHRDVKDDNIMATDSVSHVTLIDFGFCEGRGQPEDAGTFWPVGAARYSPPSKLLHPKKTHPTHDVFAVGVVGYLLLTNEYPWSVPASEDFGDLRELMLSKPPVLIEEIRPPISKEVSSFFTKLLDIDDDRRPSASEARDEAKEILLSLANKLAPPAITHGRRIVFPRVMRDPLHGDIRMTEFEWQILKSKEFQRLRRIKQLGFTHLVYTGAEHTRMSHTVGTVHIADKILRGIEDIAGQSVATEQRLMARTYALIHDITHIAYGHTLEDELGFYKRHDINERRIIRLLLSDKSEIGNLLRSTEYARSALAHLDPASTVVRHTHIKNLVDGHMGADVLDYIDRDAYFCGLDHGVDSAIYRRYKLVPVKQADLYQQRIVTKLFGAHGLRHDAEYSLEYVLLERFALFLKVYTHPAKVAAGAMLGKALAEAIYRGKNSDIDEPTLEWMGDTELLLLMRDSRRRLCSNLSKMLMQRNLYVPAYRASALSREERSIDKYLARAEQFREKGVLSPQSRMDIERDLAKRSRLKPPEVIVYCPESPPGIQKVRQYVEEFPGATVVRDELTYHDVRERHLGLWKVYVFGAPSLEKKALQRLGEVAEEFFGPKNELETDRQQTRLF